MITMMQKKQTHNHSQIISVKHFPVKPSVMILYIVQYINYMIYTL